MKYLLKKLLRDIRRSMGQYIAVTLVVLLGVGFFVGLSSASSGVRVNIDEFYERQGLADLWVRGAFSDYELSAIRKLPGVECAEARATFTLSDGDKEFIAHTVTHDINIPFIESGRLPASPGECIIDMGYAEVNHVSIGDVVCGYRLVGIFNSPEHLYLSKSITENPTHENYGALYVYGPEANAMDANAKPNEIVLRTKPNSDMDKLRSEIRDIIPGGVMLERRQQLSYMMLDDDIEQFGKIGVVFPIIFFVVAAAIIYISMSKNVETQRAEIGCMKALGIRSRDIGFHFLSYTLLSCLIGSILGALLGVFALVPAVQTVFTAFYTMPAMHPAGYVANIIIAVSLAFFFGILACLVSVRRPLRESPASAMRPKAPRKVKPILPERSERLWQRISYGHKIVLRNLFLNKGRALLSSIGIIGCVGLMLAAFSFLDCIKYLLVDEFEQMNNYDISVVMAAPGAAFDAATGIPEGTAIERCGSEAVSFEADGGSVSSDLIVMDADASSVALYGEDGRRLAFPKDGVLAPKLYMDRYGLAVGDSLNLTLAPLVGEPYSIEVRVAGVAMEYLGQDIYTSFEYAESCGASIPVTGYYLSLPESANDPADADTDQQVAMELASSIKQDPAVKLAMTKEDIANTWAQSVDIMYTMVIILIAASSVLALTVVYNISAINIFERRRDIATLKVLGYRRKEVNKLVFEENLIITGFGAVLGIAAGAGMLKLIIEFVASDDMIVPMIMSPLSVLYAVLLGFTFTGIANLFLRGKVRRIDMVTSLKSVE